MMCGSAPSRQRIYPGRTEGVLYDISQSVNGFCRGHIANIDNYMTVLCLFVTSGMGSRQPQQIGDPVEQVLARASRRYRPQLQNLSGQTSPCRYRSARPRLKLTEKDILPTTSAPSQGFPKVYVVSGSSSGPHHQDSGEAKIRESTAGVSRKPSSDCKACGSSSKHLCGLTAWNT